MKNHIIGIALISALLAIASKLMNFGWLTFLFPIWGAYILLYILGMALLSKMVKNESTAILNSIYKIVTTTFLFSFLLFPDAGDGNYYVFFDLIHFDNSGYGTIFTFLNEKYFQYASLGLAVVTLIICVGVIIARIFVKNSRPSDTPAS